MISRCFRNKSYECLYSFEEGVLNAREQIKSMMTFGFSAQVIQTYLLRWARWWVRTVKQWNLLELLKEFQERSFDNYLKIFVEALIQDRFSEDVRPVSPSVPA